MIPKISVIMGVYNGSNYLKESIESIKNQTFKNWELIICDDASTDNSREIIKTYCKNDPRIKLIYNYKNLGLAASLNRCLKYAQGEYIARQDADDISLPTRLEKQLNFLETNKSYDLVGTNAYLINSNSEIWGKILMKQEPSNKDLIKTTPYIHASIMATKNLFKKLGGYNENAVRVEDYDLWFRMHSIGSKGFNLQEPLIKVRWDIKDYSRRKYTYRIKEFKVRVEGYKLLRLPFYYYIYALKPLIVGIIPHNILFKIHYNRFKID